MLPIKFMASCRYLRFAMMASSRSWLIDPNTLLKSMYSKKISCWMNLESSRAAVRVCSCRDVYLSCLNPSWLFCKI